MLHITRFNNSPALSLYALCVAYMCALHVAFSGNGNSIFPVDGDVMKSQFSKVCLYTGYIADLHNGAIICF